MWENCGCEFCADTCNELDKSCSCNNSGCALLDCLCGDGCTKECGSRELNCGGCNRTCFTGDGGGCEGCGCGDDTCRICNFSCGPNLSKAEGCIYYYIPEIKEEICKKYTVQKYKLPEKLDVVTDWEYSDYFNVVGYYENHDGGKKVLEADGTIVDEEAVQNGQTLRAELSEKRAGEDVVVRFDTAGHDELVLNPVVVTIGQTIDGFRIPQLEGYRFVGWRGQNWRDECEPIIVEEGRTVFHLYTFGADADAGSVTLKPVFEKI